MWPRAAGRRRQRRPDRCPEARRAPCRARVLAREAAVICGAPWAEAAARAGTPPCASPGMWPRDSAAPRPGGAGGRGRRRALLSAERTALNFPQLLSAVATQDGHLRGGRRGTRAHIVDTRKTIPGLRLAQKYAVRGRRHQPPHRPARRRAHQGKPHCRCGRRQRRAAGRAAGGRARAVHRDRGETLEQLREALGRGRKNGAAGQHAPCPCCTRRCESTRAAPSEISGGVTLEGLRALAETGVDRISIGTLTKDVKATDFSMRLQELE